MLNNESNAQKIVSIACEGDLFGIDKDTKEVCKCSELVCDNCFLNVHIYPYNRGACAANRTHWANSDPEKMKEFTEQERHVIEALDKIEWVAKDKDGIIWGYDRYKPYKIDGEWYSTGNVGVNLSKTTSCKFEAIESTDIEPTHRLEILNEVLKK